MEWFTFNEVLNKSQLIEGFESFIWTERYNAFGDFQIVIKSTPAARKLLKPGTMIGMDGSYYVMTISTVDDATDQNGERLMTVVGESLERMLDDRVAMLSLDGTAITPTWDLTGTPQAIANAIFQFPCNVGSIDSSDIFPFYHGGTLIGDGNLGEPSVTVSVSLSPDTVYNSVKVVCDAYNLGFRIIKDPTAESLYFEVYVGNNRTLDQDTLSPVVFDPGMDTFTQVRVLSSIASLKTVAYVFAKNDAIKVNAPGTESGNQNFDRHVMVVNSTNPATAGSALTAALTQEGLNALAQQKAIYAFDGTLPQPVQYTYGVDYYLGDLIEERVSDSLFNQMLVTEQIFVSDDQGERSYPTLTATDQLVADDWESEVSVDWDTIDPTITWATA